MTINRDKAIRVAIFCAIITAIAVGCALYAFGVEAGKLEAIRNSQFYIVDYDAPVEFDGIEYDTSLFIELDGNIYEQGLYIG